MAEFHKTSENFNSKMLTESEFKKASQLGITDLIEVKSQYGRVKLMHLYDAESDPTYTLLYFPNSKEEPYIFSLELKQFHMLVTFFIVGVQVRNQQESDASNHPMNNFFYNVEQILNEHELSF